MPLPPPPPLSPTENGGVPLSPLSDENALRWRLMNQRPRCHTEETYRWTNRHTTTTTTGTDVFVGGDRPPHHVHTMSSHENPFLPTDDELDQAAAAQNATEDAETQVSSVSCDSYKRYQNWAKRAQTPNLPEVWKPFVPPAEIIVVPKPKNTETTCAAPSASVIPDWLQVPACDHPPPHPLLVSSSGDDETNPLVHDRKPSWTTATTLNSSHSGGGRRHHHPGEITRVTTLARSTTTNTNPRHRRRHSLPWMMGKGGTKEPVTTKNINNADVNEDSNISITTPPEDIAVLPPPPPLTLSPTTTFHSASHATDTACLSPISLERQTLANRKLDEFIKSSSSPTASKSKNKNRRRHRRQSSYCVSGSGIMCLIMMMLLVLNDTGVVMTPVTAAASSGSISAPSTTQTLPRSKSKRRLAGSLHHHAYPPWNTSPHIQHDGFVKTKFTRIPGTWESEHPVRTNQRLRTDCRIRQVPGEGNCLFHSLSLCYKHAVNGTHWDMEQCLEDLYEHSYSLRQQAVALLGQPRKRLFVQGRDFVQSRDLVASAAAQYGMSSEEYCSAMKQESVWGGGPEIVALCNILKRPIHVYELTTAQSAAAASEKAPATTTPHEDTFVLRRMACFGSPRFDSRDALHILSADSRFPDLEPGEQLASGNHFLALFPTPEQRRKRLRGGGEDDTHHNKHGLSKLSIVNWFRRQFL